MTRRRRSLFWQVASGKTNLRELMDEIKVAKTSENQKAILDKYHEAGRRKRQF